MEDYNLLYRILTYCPPPVLFPVVVSFFVYNKLPFYFRVFCLFLYISLGFEFVGYYLASNGINNLFLMHAFVLLEFSFVSYFYSNLLESYIHKRTMLIIILVFNLFSLINSIFIQKYVDLNTYARIVEMLILFIFSLMYAYKSFRSLVSDRSEESVFWVNMGYLIYTMTATVILILGDYVIKNSQERIDTWLINFIFLFVLNIFVSIGLLRVLKFPMINERVN